MRQSLPQQLASSALAISEIVPASQPTLQVSQSQVLDIPN